MYDFGKDCTPMYIAWKAVRPSKRRTERPFTHIIIAQKVKKNTWMAVVESMAELVEDTWCKITRENTE